MQSWPSILVCLLFLLCAVAWMGIHWYGWRRSKQGNLPGEEYDYRRRQFRRRMQTSSMLAMLALAVLFGPLIRRPPALVLAFWGAVFLLLCWVVLLALVDIWATKHYFYRLQQKHFIEEAQLQVQLRRARALRGNGKPPEQKTSKDEAGEAGS